MENLVEVRFDFWSALLAFGIFQGLLLILVLLSYKRNSTTFLLLGMVSILLLNLLNHLLLSTRLFIILPHLIYLFTPTFYLLGPIYFWHIMSVVQPDYKPTQIWLHLIPFFLSIIILMPFTLLGGSEKIALLDLHHQSALTPMSLPTFLFISGQILQSFLYIFNANKVLKDVRQKVQSRQAIRKTQWLSKFSLVFLVFWVVDFLALIIYLSFGAIHQEVFYISTLCSALFINVLVIFAIKNNKEFNQVLLNNKEAKYKNSTLSGTEYNEVLNKITNYMEGEKPYLDPELSLSKLAGYLNISTNQISQVLNLVVGKTFYEFVNEYRFNEAKFRLRQDEYKHLTILAIALDSGFNNKNTFNKVFKKHSGLTPSQYLKENSFDQQN